MIYCDPISSLVPTPSAIPPFLIYLHLQVTDGSMRATPWTFTGDKPSGLIRYQYAGVEGAAPCFGFLNVR